MGTPPQLDRDRRPRAALRLGLAALLATTLAPSLASAQVCDGACAKAYVQGLRRLRDQSPTGTELYDQLTFKPTTTASRAAPKARPKARPHKLTFAEMLENAPKRPVVLSLPKAPASAAAKPRPAPVGDKGGPLDQAACEDQRDAAACNRCGRLHWDRLSGGRDNDPHQMPTLQAAAKWYGKACDLDVETACWEAIGLLQRIQRVRPILR